MLNISENSITERISNREYSTLQEVEGKRSKNTLKKLLYVTFFVIVLALFLPWTQNIRTSGSVTTIKPDQRPQSITTIIGGQVAKWYVQEGDLVQKGDTILKISEIKDAYFDVNLLSRTKNQVDLKKESITTYGGKLENQDNQLLILENQKDLKLSQSKIKLNQAILKVQNDSIANETALINFEIATYRLKRTDSLFTLGLKSLTDLEGKRLKQQQLESYKVKAENDWLNSKSTVLNLRIEIFNVTIKYEADRNKIQSDQLSTIGNKIDAESNLNKLENQYSNYEFRTNLYYIIAPQNGYVTKMAVGGIGETVKAGQEILTLMPKDYDLAIEIYVDPVDLPLITIGQEVRLQFDGWPAIVFSGWPQVCHGTYGGQIYAIDQFISPNGKYRLLVKQDKNDHQWPDALRFGGGVSSMILLDDVFVGYELWRNINGFPPNFYQKTDKSTGSDKKKK